MGYEACHKKGQGLVRSLGIFISRHQNLVHTFTINVSTEQTKHRRDKHDLALLQQILPYSDTFEHITRDEHAQIYRNIYNSTLEKKKIPSNNFMPGIRTHKVVPPQNDASFSNTGKEAAFSLFSMLGSFRGSREPAPEDQGQQEEGKGKFVTKDDPYVYKVSHHMKLKKKRQHVPVVFLVTRKLISLCPRNFSAQKRACEKKHQALCKISHWSGARDPAVLRAYIGQTGRCIND